MSPDVERLCPCCRDHYQCHVAREAFLCHRCESVGCMPQWGESRCGRPCILSVDVDPQADLERRSDGDERWWQAFDKEFKDFPLPPANFAREPWEN